MSQRWSRRSFVSLSSGLGALGISAIASKAWGQAPAAPPPALSAADAFPAQDPSLVKDAVGASHGNVKRIRELVEAQPALARASIDWGFGDWETCIDAAAHVGQREIAEFLLTNGARPTIFSAAMMGQLDVVTAFVAARPGVQKTYGPHGITLLAPADRDALVGKYAFGIGTRDYFTIDVQNDRLGIERPSGPARRFLIHTGNMVFFPAGVPTAKIAFAREGGKVTQMTLADPNVMVTATRK
ncbi:MAG: hypothetical protein Q7R30_12020 [Acidobacteriota bacterium]|nr:hypothetical protein [Acidobacteriota bacterium]